MSLSATSDFSDYKSVSLLGRVHTMLRPARWYRRRMMRKPGSTTALTAAALLGGFIITNAIALQTERHPAPIFTSLTAPAPVSEVATLAQVPVPVKRPQAERKAEPMPAAQAAPSAQPRDPARPAATRSLRDEPQRTASIAAQPRDQIGALISAGMDDAPDGARRALQVQKALNKAGFGPLKEDGSFGTGTRQALEKFEAARKLPVKGEMQGKTLRELARASGVAID